MAGYSHCRCADYWPAASRTPAAWARICRARSLESAPCPERGEACRRRMQVVQWSKVSSYVPPGPRFHYDKFCRGCYCRWRALYPSARTCTMKRKVRSQTVTAIEDQDDGVETRVRRMTILRSLSVDDP